MNIEFRKKEYWVVNDNEFMEKNKVKILNRFGSEIDKVEKKIIIIWWRFFL